MTDRPALEHEEIEITPHMREVGAFELAARMMELTRPSSPSLFEEVAVDIYLTMKKANT